MWGWIVSLGIFFWLLLIALIVAPFVFWILKIIRLSKNEDKTGMWVVLACGIFLSPLVGWLIGLAFKEENKIGESEKGIFVCGICYVKYKEEYLDGELGREGKICRFCLEKRQRGEKVEVAKDYPRDIPEPLVKPTYYQSEPGKSRQESGERKILLRQLNRVQSKKNSYLTQFIINLSVLQWLLPLITIVIFWIQIKEQMKVQAMNNPELGLPMEIPFKTILKDFFKMLTSEHYVYGGHNIGISLLWKIGIVLALLLPLGFWIYNLVRFLGANGEVKQLETEIKELDR